MRSNLALTALLVLAVISLFSACTNGDGTVVLDVGGDDSVDSAGGDIAVDYVEPEDLGPVEDTPLDLEMEIIEEIIAEIVEDLGDIQGEDEPPIPEYDLYCEPCESDEDCVTEAGGACVDIGDEGGFCSNDCEADEDCPQGYVCEETDDGLFCLPASDSCVCGPGGGLQAL